MTWEGYERRSGDDRREPFCISHEQNMEVLNSLRTACAENSTTLKLTIRFAGGCISILALVMTVFIPMMYHDSKQTNTQITSIIAGVNSNRKDIKRQDVMLQDFEERLRGGNL